MAVVAEELVSDLIVRDGKLRSGLRSAQQAYGQGIGQMRGETTRFERAAGGSFAAVGSAAAKMFAALAAGVSVKAFLDLADAAKQIDAQLKLATASSGSFAQAQEDVRRIANETRVGLKETADLYATLQRNSQELGISQAQAAQATETITKAFQISGASAAEAAGGLRQFLQGIQSGVLRGEELNSVLENAPRLARALADGLGVTIGQLRALGQAGELTGAEVIAALEGATDSINAEFAELPVTFDQAMTKIYNSALITFGAFDEGGQFSTALANFITGGADGFADLEDSARSFGQTVSAELAGFIALAEAGADAVRFIADAWNGWPRQVIEELNTIANLLNPIQITMDLIRRNPIVANARAARERQLSNEAGERRITALNRGRDALGNPIGGGATPRATTASAGGGAARRGGGRARAERSPLNQEAFEREEARLNDQILRLKAEEITDIETRADVEIKRLQAANQASVREVQGNAQYTAAQKAQIAALLGSVSALEEAQIVAARDAELAKRKVEAEEENLRYYLDALRSQASITTNRKDRLAIENRILDALEQQETNELEIAIASGRIADAARARADLAASQSARRAGVAEDGQSPLERYASGSGRDPREEAEMMVVRKIQAVNDGIADALANELGVKDQFVKDLFSMFLEDVIFRPLAEALSKQGAAGGGLGGIFSAVGSVIGGLFGGGKASGGPVSAGRIYRVNEGAPEFFQPASDGRIIPMSQAAAARPAGGMGGGPVVVQLTVGEGQLFEPRVQAISGDVSIRTVQAAAPSIVKTANAQAARLGSRPRV